MSSVKYFILMIGVGLLLMAPVAYFKRHHQSEKLAVPSYEMSFLFDEKLLKKLQEKSSLSSSHTISAQSYIDAESHQNRITLDFFRCKGSSLHPPIPIMKDGKVVENIFDCGGLSSHSLPTRDGKEYVYPILIDILNEIQIETKKQLVITSGHRCSAHHRYVTARGVSSSAKHMVGAAVSFYIVGLERAQEEVMKIILNYYRKSSLPEKERGKYLEFKQMEKGEGCSMPSWYNKEICVKFYKENEGRDVDNSHPFPYVSIQVRFDRATQKEVSFKQSEADSIYRY